MEEKVPIAHKMKIELLKSTNKKFSLKMEINNKFDILNYLIDLFNYLLR